MQGTGSQYTHTRTHARTHTHTHTHNEKLQRDAAARTVVQQGEAGLQDAGRLWRQLGGASVAEHPHPKLHPLLPQAGGGGGAPQAGGDRLQGSGWERVVVAQGGSVTVCSTAHWGIGRGGWSEG